MNRACNFLAALALAVVAGTAAAQTPAPHSIEVPRGWSVFVGQNVVVPHPIGWQVQERGEGAFAVYEPGAGNIANAVILVKPLSSIGEGAMSIAMAAGVIAPDLFPGAERQQGGTISQQPEVGVGTFGYTVQGEAFHGSGLCFKEGERGVVYYIAARESLWQEKAPLMQRILTSFFYSGAAPRTAASAQAGMPEFVSWRDPKEGAFTVPVPRGWSVEGGLTRYSALEFQPEVVATSADETMLVRFGDAEVRASMRLPHPTLTQGGWPEGARTPDGQLVMRYLPGAQFLREIYFPQRIGEVGNMTVRDLPEVSRQLMALYAPILVATQVRVDTSEVRFTVQSESGPLKGYAFAQTILYFTPSPPTEAQVPGIGHWAVSQLYGYLSTPQNESTAQRVLARMVSGFGMDAQWTAAQRQTGREVWEIERRSRAEISAIIDQTFATRSTSQERTHQARTEAIRDETLIRDPTTGQQFTVPSGPNYYYRIGAGAEFIGTETADAPNSPHYWVQKMEVIR